MDVEDPKAELDATGEDLDKNSAEADDPTPASFRIVMLTKCGRFWIESFESWNDLIVIVGPESLQGSYLLIPATAHKLVSKLLRHN